MSLFNNAIIGASGQGGYRISRSVRLRSSASGYFGRTPASAGSRTTWTWSAWVKRGELTRSTTGGVIGIFGGGTLGVSQSNFVCYFNSSFDIYLQETVNNVSNQLIYQTTSLYRDPSAWYHIIIAMDTTQATAANRTKVYVNGVQAPGAFSVTPAQNQALSINNTVPQYIGGASVNPQAYGNVLSYFDGYLTEINFIDGQALTPSSFGETNAITGVWQPKRYAGTYGTNGFYLNFSDNSGVTATTIGKDYSGNGNNWTPNNISVTAGVTYDSMLDVPTLYADGGNGRGNYAVLNVLSQHASNVTTLSGGNLNVSGNGCLATISMPSGKWYWEATCTSADADQAVGILDIFESNTGAVSGTINPNRGVIYQANTNVRKNGTIVANYATFTNGDVLGLTFDASNNQIAFYKNNTLQGTITADAPTVSYVPHAQTLGGAFSYNFGQRPFTYTPPTGFVALNTQNLPTPTISNGATVMAATTYTGTGASLTIANTVNNVSFQPDLVWVKGRSGATDHAWYDAVRGVQKQLESNTTTAETTETTGLTAFGSTGFTVGALAQMNTSAATYVAWQWNAGGSTVTNTSGTISSQVRANATAGFSVVTWTGAGSAGTIGHGLGVTPSMIIIKNRSGIQFWFVNHTSISATQNLYLNDTSSVQSDGIFTSRGSTTFGVGAGVAASSTNYVAYCFAAVAGYSAFGSYTGNASTDGTFVYLGFEPRWVMIKRTDTTGDWQMYDTSRAPINVASNTLYANGAFAEDSNTTNRALDLLSNGFKLRSSASFLNASGGTYVYACFAENPFKLSLAR